MYGLFWGDLGLVRSNWNLSPSLSPSLSLTPTLVEFPTRNWCHIRFSTAESTRSRPIFALFRSLDSAVQRQTFTKTISTLLRRLQRYTARKTSALRVHQTWGGKDARRETEERTVNERVDWNKYAQKRLRETDLRLSLVRFLREKSREGLRVTGEERRESRSWRDWPGIASACERALRTGSERCSPRASSRVSSSSFWWAANSLK